MLVLAIMWLAAVTVTGWKASQLLRFPHDRGLRVITGCIALVALALTAQVVVMLPGLARHLPHDTPVLVEFLLLNAFFVLLLGLLHNSVHFPTAQRRTVTELGIATIFSAALVVVFVCGGPTSTQDFADYPSGSAASSVLVFYCIGNVYMAYATVHGSLMAWNSEGYVLPDTHRGLRCAAIGLGICCLGAHIPRAVSTGSRLALGIDIIPGTASWSGAALGIGVAVFFAGIAWPGVRSGYVKGCLWLQARRQYLALRPLWADLHRAFPTIALLEPTTARQEIWQVRQMRMRHYRRTVEIHDALVNLGPYMDGPPRGVVTAAQYTNHIRGALQLYSAGQGPVEHGGAEIPGVDLVAVAREYVRQNGRS